MFFDVRHYGASQRIGTQPPKHHEHLLIYASYQCLFSGNPCTLDLSWNPQHPYVAVSSTRNGSVRGTQRNLPVYRLDKSQFCYLSTASQCYYRKKNPIFSRIFNLTPHPSDAFVRYFPVYKKRDKPIGCNRCVYGNLPNIIRDFPTDLRIYIPKILRLLRALIALIREIKKIF